MISLLALTIQAVPVETGSEIIYVTGDRAGEERTSLAISRIDSDQLALTGAQHVAEIINQLPGVNLHRGNGAEHLTAIRSPVLTGGAGAGSFLYLEDGIALRAAGFGNVNGLFENLNQLAGGVELVRGPGPALYGSNALHGLVNTLTPRPGERGELEVELGSFGRYRGRLVSGWGENAVVGLAGQHEDGWRDDAGLDRVEGFARFDGQWGEVSWSWRTAAASLNQETAGFVRGPLAYEDLALARSNADPEAYRDAWAVRSALFLTGDLDADWSWRLTPYLRANRMDFLMHFVPSEALEESGHDSLGLQASLSRDDAAGGRLTLGLDVERTAGALSEVQERPTIFSFVQGTHYDYEVDADVLALYAQRRWALSEQLAVFAGLRWEATRFDYDNRTATGVTGRFQRLADREDSFDVLTPSFGAIWSEGDHQFSARLARGARAPQTAELYRLQAGQVIDAIEPETLDSLEAGYRRDLAGGGYLDLTGFLMQKRNVFFRDADGINVTDGKTSHHGVELALFLPLGERLSAQLAGSWARHEYDFDRPVGNASEAIRAGDLIDTAPEWMWTAGLNWQVGERMATQLEWRHVGEYAMNAANTNVYEGHDLVNLRAQADLAEGVEVFAAVRNLFDTRYAERADFAFGSERYFPGEERAFSLGVRLRR